MLGTTIKYKLKLDHCQSLGIEFTPVNKMKMFYFFCTEEEGHNYFYSQTSPLKITFFCNDMEIGNVELTLKEVSVA